MKTRAAILAAALCLPGRARAQPDRGAFRPDSGPSLFDGLRERWEQFSHHWKCRRRPALLLHSHNDYKRQRPLDEALESRFDSVEADVHLVGGELLVAHERGEVRPGRTLQSLYLDPLRKRASANGGWVLPDRRSLVLLVDIKSDARPTYGALKKVLAGYEDLLTVHESGAARLGAITVLISGNRPREAIAAEPRRLVALDGDSSDMDSDAPVDLIPWISIGWTGFMKESGFEAEEPPARRKNLIRDVADRVHGRGRKLRFWGLPDDEAAWEVEFDADVDILNTDHPAAARRFADRCPTR